MTLLRTLWEIMSRAQRRLLLGAQAVSLLMAINTVIGIASIGPFFAVLGNPQLIERNVLLHWAYQHAGFDSYRRFVIALGLAFVGMAAVSSAVNLAGSVAINRLALAIGDDLQICLFGEYLSRPYLFHARADRAELFNNVIYETARVSNGILHNIFTLTTGCITSLFIIASILVVDPVLDAAMLALLGGGYAVIYLTVRHRLLRWGRVHSCQAVEQGKVVNESFAAIRQIIAQQAQHSFRDRFELASKAVSGTVIRTHLVGQSPKNIMECVAISGLVGIALLMSASPEGIAPALGKLSFLGFAAYRLLPTLQQIFAALVRIRADTAGFAVIAPDLRRARIASRRAGVIAGRHGEIRCHRQIELVDASFRYADDRPPAVRNITLGVQARSVVGLVGPNGSGKTTVMDLLAGLLEPTSGELRIDGVALDTRGRTAWRSQIAYVPQEVPLLDASVAANIAFGMRDADIDPQRMLRAARLALLDDLVMTLPGRYNFRIGERGVALSGGQRQRLGIARALYQQASVLLLDEATNELDGLTEIELLATLARLHGQYTMILIAHRLSTVRSCDKVYEFEDGAVVSSGTYEELLKRSSRFRRLTGVR